MTCIIGLIHNKRLYMGGDSRVSFGDGSFDTIVGQKIARIVTKAGDPLLIGHSGAVRDYNIVRQRIADMLIDSTKDTASIVDDMAEHIRNALNDRNASCKSDGKDVNASSFLIGYRSRMFMIASEYSIVELARPFMSIGSGSPYAMGAMAATDFNMVPTERILRSLTIAGNFDCAVGPPYYVESIMAEYVPELNDGNTNTPPHDASFGLQK